MAKLFNLLAYGSGIGWTLYTLYDRVYIEETTTSLTFRLVLYIVIIVAWRYLHKKIFEEAQIQEGNMLITVPRFPRARALYVFGVIIGLCYVIADFFKYVEQREIPLSYTIQLIGIAWLLGLGFKLIAVYFEKRKETKIKMLEAQ